MSAESPSWSRWKAKVESELARPGAGASVDKLFAKLADGLVVAPFYPEPLAGATPIERAGVPELVSWPVISGADELDLRPIEQDGASPVEELASALVALHAAPDVAALHFGVSPDILLQIAKLRAIRRLVGRLAELDPSVKMPLIVAHTSLRAYTRHDPWVNLLRNSAAVFAALLGGADRVVAAPYDVALGEPSDEAKRLADHTVRIAMHEASLGLEADPTAGSHALEHLTEALCIDAWALAAAQATTPTAIRDRIAQTKATRATRIARRQDNLIGTTLYPDPDEVVPVRPTAADLGPRLALPYERLRARASDANARVFLATFGPLAHHTARTSWVAQLLAAGGIRPVDTTPATAVGYPSIEDVADAFAASKTSVAILCVADADWGDAFATLIALADALTTRGASVLVAGRPTPALTAPTTTVPALIAGFVHAGQPALDVLTDLHTRLGLDGASS